MVEREGGREAAGPAARARVSRAELLEMACHLYEMGLRAGRASRLAPTPSRPAPVGPCLALAAAAPPALAGVPAFAVGAAAVFANLLADAALEDVAAVAAAAAAARDAALRGRRCVPSASAAGILAALVDFALQLSLVAPVQVQLHLQLLAGHGEKSP